MNTATKEVADLKSALDEHAIVAITNSAALPPNSAMTTSVAATPNNTNDQEYMTRLQRHVASAMPRRRKRAPDARALISKARPMHS